MPQKAQKVDLRHKADVFDGLFAEMDTQFINAYPFQAVFNLKTLLYKSFTNLSAS
jgi:hypothetical protein